MSSNPNTMFPHCCVMQNINGQKRALFAGAKLKPRHSSTHSYIQIFLGTTGYSEVYAELNIAAVNELVKDLQQLVSEFVERELNNENQTD